eukprot:136147-Lingulodinium_polyedra.AAC.1
MAIGGQRPGPGSARANASQPTRPRRPTTCPWVRTPRTTCCARTPSGAQGGIVASVGPAVGRDEGPL